MNCDLSAAPKITLTNFKVVGANSVVGVTFAAVNPGAGIDDTQLIWLLIFILKVHTQL